MIAHAATREPDAAEAAEILALYDRGLFVQAYRRICAVGDPLGWRSASACVLAARVLGKVGAPRASTLLILRAQRTAPADPSVGFYYAMHVLERDGPYAALERLGRLVVDGASAEVQADVRLARALMLAALRDFPAAEYEIVRAELIDPRSSWSQVIRSSVLDDEDRPEAALEAAREALRLRPDYLPALEAATQALHKLGRIDEAADLLADAVTRVEAGELLLRLAHLELARERPQVAREWLARVGPLFPCPEPGLWKMLAAMGAHAAYDAGDLDEAIRLARAAETPSLLRFADRLAAGGDLQKVRLAVPAVRQAHRTCGPATLASISLFFGEPAEHLAIADEICFDGTTIASEREWVVGRGFAVREFTVTWDSATALLDRGLPFALCTQQPTSAHAQAVIGHDTALRMLAVRDPSAAVVVLYDADRLLQAQAWSGPHGLVFAPQARAAELAALSLPDGELHDLAFTAAAALRVHDRERASLAIAELTSRAPSHAVTVAATRSLAAYDGNAAAMLAVVDAQLQQHPDADALQFMKLRCLAALGQRDERRALLERLTGGPPIFDQLLAEDLLTDGRAHARAEALLRRCLRFMPDSPGAYRSLALLRLRQSRPDDARVLLRFAACLGNHDETDTGLYVAACRQAGALADALSFLQARFERDGRRFAEPAQALYLALDSHGRTADALAVLDEALGWRPSDGELLLFTARARADFGQMDRARELLARALGQAPDAAWQAVAAHLDVLDGALANARSRYERVLADNPLAIAAYRDIAPLDAALAGPSAALARVEAAAARFPHHAALARLRVEWTPDEGDAGIAALRTLHAVAPDELDGACELALRLGRRGALDEAQAIVDQVLARAPHAAVGHGLHAQLALWRGEDDVAAESLRAAIHASIDAVAAIHLLVATARGDAARSAAVAHVRGELRRQISDGAGLTAYRQVAANIDAPAEILALLDEYRAHHPELLAGWIEAAHQLVAMQRLADARALAEEATRRFPLQVEAHLVYAELLGEGGPGEARPDAQIAALETAVALAPGAASPRIALAQALGRADQRPRAIDLLTHAVRRDPLDADLHAALAEQLWLARERHAAIDRLISAIEVDPGAIERWELLRDLSQETGQHPRALAAAHALVQARPRSGWARIGLAIVSGDDRHDERLAALDEALAQDPRILWAHDERARLLALAQQWDAALAACDPPIYGGRAPLRLRGRAAWIRRCSGERARAVAEMQAVVAESPGYGFGWCCLGDWASEDGLPQQAMAAYRSMLRHNPGAVPVALALFELEFAGGERAAAARTIGVLRAAGAHAQAEHAELRLMLVRDGWPAALERVTTMACDATTNPGTVAAALDLVAQTIDGETMSTYLEQLVERPDAQPVVGQLWAQWRPFGTMHWWTVPRRLRALRARGKIGVEATAIYLNFLSARPLGLTLWLFVAREGASLRADLRLWALVGAVYRLRGWYGRARRWFADWAARDGLEPWMLRHIAATLRWSGDTAEARAASTRALALPGVDVEHPLWLALDAALEAPGDVALKTLAPISLPQDSDAADRWVFARCKALLAARDTRLAPAHRQALVRGYVHESEACGATRCERPLLRRLRTIVDRRISALLAGRG